MRAANTNPATAELVSCDTTLERIREDFAFLDHWEDRYRYIIELGDALPHMQDDLKTPENLVHGCMSNAWILARAKDGRLALGLESEARIVRGLIAILLCAVQGSRLEDAARHDFESLFSELDLVAHLSPSRGNGLRSLVERVKSEATKLISVQTRL